MNKKKIIIFLPLWNKSNIDRFFNTLLPLQFSNDNLCVFNTLNYDAAYYIYTFKEHIKTISQSRNFNKLCDLINVKIKSIDNEILSKTIVYKKEEPQCTILAYNLAFKTAIDQKAGLIMMNDNFVLYDAFFKDLIFIYEQGCSSISIPKITLSKDTFLTCFIDEFKKQKNNNFSKKDLIKIFLNHMHNYKKNSSWANILKGKINFFWSAENHSLLIRFLNVHPIFIDLHDIKNKTVFPIQGVDSVEDAWTDLLKIDKSQNKIIEDSNDLIVYEICSLNQFEIKKLSIKLIYTLWYFLKIYAKLPNLYLFKNHKFFLHYEDDNISKEKLINKSQKIIDKITNKFQDPTIITKFFWLFIKFFEHPNKLRVFIRIILKLFKMSIRPIYYFKIIEIISFPVNFLLKHLKIKVINVTRFHAIGHFTVEPEFYIKEHYPFSKIRNIIFCSQKKMVSNNALLEYWKKYFNIITSPFLNLLFFPLKKIPNIQFHTVKYTYPGNSNIYVINKNRDIKLFDLNEKHLLDGKKTLSKLNIPKDAWYVCFNARSSGCNQNEDDLVLYRNSNIETLFLALKEIEKRGGWCIRIGNKYPLKLSKKFNELKHFVDYSNSDYVSDWMDLFFASTCKFFLGSSISGLYHLPMIFHTPCVMVNVLPFTALPHRKTDLVIFKNYYSIFDKKLLTFPEILSSYDHNSTLSIDYIRKNVIPIDNTEKEIKDVVMEMLDRIENKNCNDPSNDILQENFKNMFKPYHFCYQFQSKIGSKFLKKYSNLFYEEKFFKILKKLN